LSPLVVTGVTSLAGRVSLSESFVGGLAVLGGAFLLAQLARDGGKKREPSLFAGWGGIPSVGIFRHRDARVDAITKARYHEKLSKLVAGAKAPSVADEDSDPVAADAVYLAWSTFVRTHARDAKKFALLLKENISYGYRRNLLGLRPLGIGIALVSMVMSGFHLYRLRESGGEVNASIAIALVFAIVMLCLWIFRFNVEWVRVPADAYAERLAEAVDSLTDSAPKPAAMKTAPKKAPDGAQG